MPSGQTQGFFNGVMDEVRIWGGARTLQQIQDGMSGEILSAPGLLGRWGFNEGSRRRGDGGRRQQRQSGTTACCSGALHLGAGRAVHDRRTTRRDAPVLEAPANGATGVASPATLNVSVSDAMPIR